MNAQLMTFGEIAERLRVSTRTLSRILQRNRHLPARSKHRLKTFKMGRGRTSRVLVRKGELERWLHERELKAT